MPAYMNKSELHDLLKHLDALAKIDPQRSVLIDNNKWLTPNRAFSNLETMSAPDGPVVSVMEGGSMVSRMNPNFDWDGPDKQVEFELGEGSLGEHIKDIQKLIENWGK
jgi:hypothetical protein